MNRSRPYPTIWEMLTIQRAIVEGDTPSTPPDSLARVQTNWGDFLAFQETTAGMAAACRSLAAVVFHCAEAVALSPAYGEGIVPREASILDAPMHDDLRLPLSELGYSIMGCVRSARLDAQIGATGLHYAGQVAGRSAFGPERLLDAWETLTLHRVRAFRESEESR